MISDEPIVKKVAWASGTRRTGASMSITDEQIGIVRKYVAEIEAENEKLRELVRRLYWMADFCRNCPDSERCDVDVEWLGCTVGDPITAEMKELGVEV